MEVHAHTHTARKKWHHYFWEFLMLFLAVFCGFLAENQREHYVEGTRAKEYAKSLLSDMKEDTVEISGGILQNSFMVEAFDSCISIGMKSIGLLPMRIPLTGTDLPLRNLYNQATSVILKIRNWLIK
jgi:hypothetical protein